jgi:putative addiction module killer protein
LTYIQGVSELRLDFGPGYRVYFGQVGRQIHLLLGALGMKLSIPPSESEAAMRPTPAAM